MRWDWYSKYIRQIFLSSSFWNIHKIGVWKSVVFHVTPWRLVRVTTVFSHKFFKSYAITLKLIFLITKYSDGWYKHKVWCVHQPTALRNWIKMHMFDKKTLKFSVSVKRYSNSLLAIKSSNFIGFWIFKKRFVRRGELQPHELIDLTLLWYFLNSW